MPNNNVNVINLILSFYLQIRTVLKYREPGSVMVYVISIIYAVLGLYLTT